MALGHPHDGHRLRAAEHHLAVRMAVFLPSPDRLSGMDVPEGYPAVALAALAVMTATYFATQSIHNLWLLLLCRILMAVVLYYLVMRIAGAAILKECMAFVKKKMGKK